MKPGEQAYWQTPAVQLAPLLLAGSPQSPAEQHPLTSMHWPLHGRVPLLHDSTQPPAVHA
jgi:hypothetical protein